MNTHSKSVLLCLVLAGCTSSAQKQAAPTPPPPAPAPSKAEKVGDSLLASPAKVWTELNCDTATALPRGVFEDQQLSPQKVAAGEQFMHRLQYALCPDGPDLTIPGTLSRKIYRQGKLIHNGQQSFDLRPGRWQVNAIIKVPEKSKLGHYVLRTEFSGQAANKKKLKLSKETPFEVTDGSNGS